MEILIQCTEKANGSIRYLRNRDHCKLFVWNSGAAPVWNSNNRMPETQYGSYSASIAAARRGSVYLLLWWP